MQDSAVRLRPLVSDRTRAGDLHDERPRREVEPAGRGRLAGVARELLGLPLPVRVRVDEPGSLRSPPCRGRRTVRSSGCCADTTPADAPESGCTRAVAGWRQGARRGPPRRDPARAAFVQPSGPCLLRSGAFHAHVAPPVISSAGAASPARQTHAGDLGPQLGQRLREGGCWKTISWIRRLFSSATSTRVPHTAPKKTT